MVRACVDVARAEDRVIRRVGNSSRSRHLPNGDIVDRPKHIALDLDGKVQITNLPGDERRLARHHGQRNF